MKFCLACQHPFTEPHWTCPSCGAVPTQREGFNAFAPDLAAQNDGFNPDTFKRYAAVEAGHFWFVGRNQVLRDRMLRHFPQARHILEIGCGTGFVLANTRRTYPDAQLSGSDIFTQGLHFAQSRVPSATLFQMDACHIPFREEFDLIGAFDVLEHIEDDQAALNQIFAACQTGGGIVLTVPQHQWLWSATDDYAHHKRRYTRRELVKKVQQAGFKVGYVSSFVSLLLPLMLASRWLQKSAQADDQMDAGFKIGKFANKLLSAVMKLERSLLSLGITFPIGGSLLLIATKGTH
ncbi:MAG: methyltransferase domain-containing protein [Gallionella sp.]|nr:methyltransferase domain-containing protein [Gallionella sp.]MDD4958553.1 methyltransferase domain-containing protein [Gallionella sp.]